MNEQARAVGLRGHVKTRKNQSANDNNVGNSDWLAALGIQGFDLKPANELVAAL